jgi:hypothetical protein
MFCIKDRYITKECFSSIEKVIDFLQEQKQEQKGSLTFQLHDKIEESKRDCMSFLGTIKYPKYGSYEVALYASYLTASEVEEIKQKLTLLEEELSLPAAA